jgi:hypothetical protein
VHRTFQEYLTAREAADRADIGMLVEKAHRESWRDVVVMAVGHANANARVREDLIGALSAAAARSSPHRPRGHHGRALAELFGARHGCAAEPKAAEPSPPSQPDIGQRFDRCGGLSSLTEFPALLRARRRIQRPEI